MRHTSSVSSKGQVTVPLEIRPRLGLRGGDRIEFVPQGDLTIVRPARESANPFTRYVGALGTFPGRIKQINAWLDDLRVLEKPRRQRRVKAGSRAQDDQRNRASTSQPAF